MQSELKAVLFDAAGTLIYPSPSAAEVYREQGKFFGLELSPAEAAARFRAAYAQALQLQDDAVNAGDGMTDEALERLRWRRIVADVFRELSRTEDLFQVLWEHFAQPSSWRLFPDAREAWEKIQARGLIAGVASNFDERLAAICPAFPLANACERLFISSRLGWRKPHGNFFRGIEKALNLGPEELLLVGDDPIADETGARGAGWRSLLIENGEDPLQRTSLWKQLSALL